MSTLFPSCLIKFFAGQFDCYPILQLLLLLLLLSFIIIIIVFDFKKKHCRVKNTQHLLAAQFEQNDIQLSPEGAVN